MMSRSTALRCASRLVVASTQLPFRSALELLLDLVIICSNLALPPTLSSLPPGCPAPPPSEFESSGRTPALQTARQRARRLAAARSCSAAVTAAPRGPPVFTCERKLASRLLRGLVIPWKARAVSNSERSLSCQKHKHTWRVMGGQCVWNSVCLHLVCAVRSQ